MCIFKIKYLFVLLCLCVLCHLAMLVRAQNEDFALEVAVIQTQECAQDLVRGLVARGYDAYMVPYRNQKGVYYRVRIGKFQDMNYARRYGESLLSSGLLDSCAVARYESPLTVIDGVISSVTGQKTDQKSIKQAEVTTKLARLPGSDDKFRAYCPIDLKKPAVTSNKTENGGAPTASENLMEALGKRKWAISADKSILYSVPKSIPARFNPEVKPASDVVFSMRTFQKTNWKLNADPKLLEAAAIASNKTNTRQIVTVTTNPKPEVSKNTVKVAPPPTIVAVSENKRPIVQPRPVDQPVRSVPTDNTEGSPRIQGFVEQRNGRLLLHLINSDQQRSFAGSARVTLNDDRLENELLPQSFRLNPNEEKIIDLKTSSYMSSGDWLLMLFDDKKAIQLIRSAPFGNKPVRPNNTVIASIDQPQIDNKDNELISWAENEDSSTEGGNKPIPQDVLNQLLNQGQESNNQIQVQVNVVRVSSTDKGTSLEMNVISSAPVGSARIMFQVGQFRDDRAVVLSALTARIPFFLPSSITANEFMYTIKSDNKTVVTSGNGRFD